MKIQIFKGTDDVVYVDDVPYYREAVDLTKAKKVIEKWEWIKSHIENELAVLWPNNWLYCRIVLLGLAPSILSLQAMGRYSGQARVGRRRWFF